MREWTPIALVLNSEVMLAGECWQVGVEVARGATWARSITLGGQQLRSGQGIGYTEVSDSKAFFFFSL